MRRVSRFRAAIALFLLMLLLSGLVMFSITVAETMFALLIVIIVIIVVGSIIKSKLGKKRK